MTTDYLQPHSKLSILKSSKSKDLWIINGIVIIAVHLISILSLVLYKPKPQTVALTIFTYLYSCISITAGYHRLWSHKCYTANFLYRAIVMFGGTLAFQASCKWWVLRHRIHHRFVDTRDDPYNAKKGFWFSHMGWLFEKPYLDKIKNIDISDIMADPLVRYQHQYYLQLVVLLGYVLPTLLAKLWHDALGGFLYVGFVSHVMIWNATFCVNSAAHYMGDQEFSVEQTSRGNFLVALITAGEGHHNYHHVFPRDYRNGVRWYHYDPTKWFILTCYYLGFVKGLWMTPAHEIEKIRLLTQQIRLDNRKKLFTWPQRISKLPLISITEFRDRVNNGEKLLIIDGVVLNVSKFIYKHPGGPELIQDTVGRDGTDSFCTKNHHSMPAILQALQLGIARLDDSASSKSENKSMGSQRVFKDFDKLY